MDTKKFLPILIIFLLLCQSSFSIGVQAKPIKLGLIETTPVHVVAEWPVNKYTQEGEHFDARVVEDVVLDNGVVLIPKGSKVKGQVAEIQRARSFRRAAHINVQFDEIVFPDQINRIEIQADGSLIDDKHKYIKAVGEATKKVLGGAALGAFAGFRFAGVLGSSLDGSNIMIGAGAGAGIALVSFIAAKGKELKIDPGLAMTLSLVNMQEQQTQAQSLIPVDTMVSAKILKKKRDKLKVFIENNRDQDISLVNLKVVDSLGYIKAPVNGFNYFDKKSIPAHSQMEYELMLPNKGHQETKRWLVLTDSFDKQEFFKIAI